MTEDLMEFNLPQDESSIIKIIGVGGGGGNAVNYMFAQGIKGVDFVVCNTDAQALGSSPVPVKIQLGESLTEGRGTGNIPEKGEQSAIENLEDVMEVLADNTKMIFITAGMGGGTGTGAAPVIAEAAREMGILTVGIVTTPFHFEGKKRLAQAVKGIERLQKNVDSLLVIDNEKLSQVYGDLKLSTAFAKADDILATAAKGIAEVITLHGYINVDFEDVKTVMVNSGIAVLGAGFASGENRSVSAIDKALNSPLLNNNDIRGAGNILLNITYGIEEITMDEVSQITNYLRKKVGDNTLIIWGTGQDTSLEDKVSVTVIAAGFTTAPPSPIAGIGKKSLLPGIQNPDSDKSEKSWIIKPNAPAAKVDEIEKTPAYKRKNIDINQNLSKKEPVVKFTLEQNQDSHEI